MAKKQTIPRPKQRKPSRIAKKMGKAPGSIIYMGDKAVAKSAVNIFEYNEETVNQHLPGNLDQIVIHKEPPMVSWVDIVGLSDEDFIATLGKRFGLNSLVLEDTVNIHQRPKIDEYDDYIFGVFKMLYLNEQKKIVVEHLAMFLMENCVLVLQELQEDVFSAVRERITKKYGRIRSRGADYLFFALLDAIVDNYYIILEHLGQRIDELENQVYENPNQTIANEIQQVKKEVMRVRRWVSPVKELISRLIDSESHLITKDTKIFLRDVQDHTLEINESLQIYREMSMSLMEMYMSTMSNRMNEVMKVLTIMASIFIPLTFIAGIYGMNFNHMPELQWEYGYYMVWGVMIALFIGMLIYFRNKRWL